MDYIYLSALGVISLDHTYIPECIRCYISGGQVSTQEHIIPHLSCHLLWPIKKKHMYMYIQKYICIHICMYCTYTYLYAHTCTHTDIHTHTIGVKCFYLAPVQWNGQVRAVSVPYPFNSHSVALLICIKSVSVPFPFRSQQAIPFQCTDRRINTCNLNA